MTFNWQDEALKQVADDFENAGDKAKADRLRHFMQGASAIASEGGSLDTPGQTPRLEAWVGERLPELAHGRTTTDIGMYWRRRLTLEGQFRRIQQADLAAGRTRVGEDWGPIIQQAEDGLKAVRNDEERMIDLTLRRLSKAERLEVIADAHGKIRKPRAMAEPISASSPRRSSTRSRLTFAAPRAASPKYRSDLLLRSDRPIRQLAQTAGGRNGGLLPRRCAAGARAVGTVPARSRSSRRADTQTSRPWE